MPYAPTRNWEGICPDCNRRFSLGEDIPRASMSESYVSVWDTIRFPEKDTSKMELTCPRCRKTIIIFSDRMIKPAGIMEAEAEELKNMVRLEELDSKNHEKEIKELQKQLSLAKTQLEKDREYNMK